MREQKTMTKGFDISEIERAKERGRGEVMTEVRGSGLRERRQRRKIRTVTTATPSAVVCIHSSH